MALLDNLIAGWELGASAGNDAVGSNHLTANGSPTNMSGWTDFETTGDLDSYSIASNSALSIVKQDCTWMIEVNIESKDPGNRRTVFGKVSSAGLTEYYLDLNGVSDRFRLGMGNGVTAQTVEASTFGAPSLSTPYILCAWYDAAAGTMNIQVNNGAVNSSLFTAGPASLGSGFAIGRLGDYPASVNWDGQMRRCRFWKRLLSIDEKTELYNGGAGRDIDYLLSSGGVPIGAAAYYYYNQLGK